MIVGKVYDKRLTKKEWVAKQKKLGKLSGKVVRVVGTPYIPQEVAPNVDSPDRAKWLAYDESVRWSEQQSEIQPMRKFINE